jgi:hypothetical protein
MLYIQHSADKYYSLWRCVLLLAIVLTNLSTLYGQKDSVDQETKPTTNDSTLFDFEFSSAHYFQPGAIYLNYLEPEYHSTFTDQFSGYTRRSVWKDLVNDNPLPHVTGYASGLVTYHPVSGVWITGGVVGEYRGMSYGVGSRMNLVVTPRFSAGVDTTIALIDPPLRLRFELGDFINRRVDEGLTLYNLDWQGGIFLLDWQGITFRFEKGADGYQGIGLNAQDMDHVSLAMDSIAEFNGWNLGTRIGFFNYSQVYDYPYEPFTPRGALFVQAQLENIGYTLSGSLGTLDGLLRVYAEAGLRLADTSAYVMNRGALVAGISTAGEQGRLSWHGHGEYRYYGGLFNANYRTDAVDLRYPEENQFSRQIPGTLYSITRFDRPFSQWGVFTEYQDMKDVIGLTAYLSASYRFLKDFLIRGVLDLNYIQAEGTSGFLYHFYDVGIGWIPASTFSIVLSATNRGMNLEKGYPTLYLYSHPWLQFALRLNVP